MHSCLHTQVNVELNFWESAYGHPCKMYLKLSSNDALPFLHTTWGRVFAQIFNCLVHNYACTVPSDIKLEVDRLQWLSWRTITIFSDRVLWEISRHMLCRYLAERDWSYLHHQWWQWLCTSSTKTLSSEQWMRLWWFVYMCIGTHSMMDLNQKVIKAWPEKTITTACLQNVSAKK